jgi:hypothetical protein
MENEMLEAALNTYRVLVMNEDPYSMIGDKDASFLLDVTDYPYLDYQKRIDSAIVTMETLAEHDHFEKCLDLQQYIKELKNEIKRLSK